jgi:hypothetical protein
VTLCEHPLDSSYIDDSHKRKSNATDYYQPSTYVHCSQPGLDNYFPEPGEAFRVLPSSGRYKQTGRLVLLNIATYLYSAICYARFGMNLERPPRLRELFQEALDNL